MQKFAGNLFCITREYHDVAETHFSDRAPFCCWPGRLLGFAKLPCANRAGIEHGRIFLVPRSLPDPDLHRDAGNRPSPGECPVLTIFFFEKTTDVHFDLLAHPDVRWPRQALIRSLRGRKTGSVHAKKTGGVAYALARHERLRISDEDLAALVVEKLAELQASRRRIKKHVRRLKAHHG